MTLPAPNFWQFYAKGVMFVALLLLPILMLHNYLQGLTIIIPLVTDAVATIFSLGYWILDVFCHIGHGCFFAGMGRQEVAFYAYVATVTLFGFVAAIYFAWIWRPKSDKPAQPVFKTETDDYFKYH